MRLANLSDLTDVACCNQGWVQSRAYWLIWRFLASAFAQRTSTIETGGLGGVERFRKVLAKVAVPSHRVGVGLGFDAIRHGGLFLTSTRTAK